MARLSLLLFATLVISGLITFALHLLFKKHKYLKYLPAALYLPIIAYNTYLMFFPKESMQDLAAFIVVILFVIALAGNVLTGIILEALRDKR